MALVSQEKGPANMGYERNDRRYGYGPGEDRPNRYSAYDDPRDRGFIDRAGDEIRSWFGDEEAERRRRIDERYEGRYDPDARDRGSPAYRSSAYGHRSNQPDDDRSAYARRYAPSTSDFARPSDIRRVGADYGQGSGYGGYGSAGYGGYGYGSRDESARRMDEYRAVYGSGHADDGHHSYHDWRDRQISSLDRDYDEYRREHQARFESDFSTWRQSRQTQRDSLQRVEEQQEVLGSDGAHVGTVDHVRGDRILLTKSDRDAGGHHHSIPSSWIQTVDDKVHLAKTAEQAKQAWRDEERSLFGPDRDTEAGTTSRAVRSFYSPS
jgi:hypothetical protein